MEYECGEHDFKLVDHQGKAEFLETTGYFKQLAGVTDYDFEDTLLCAKRHLPFLQDVGEDLCMCYNIPQNRCKGPMDVFQEFTRLMWREGIVYRINSETYGMRFYDDAFIIKPFAEKDRCVIYFEGTIGIYRGQHECILVESFDKLEMLLETIREEVKKVLPKQDAYICGFLPGSLDKLNMSLRYVRLVFA